MWRRCCECFLKLDVLWRVGEMVFAADYVRNFHLDIVDHVHEMKDPRAVGPANRHVGMGARIGEIEIDFAADEIVDDNVLPWRTEPQRNLIFKNMAGVLKFFSVALVDFSALALKGRTQI